MERDFGHFRSKIVHIYCHSFADIVVKADLGTPFPNLTLKLSEGDQGEVLVKTPSLFLG